MYIRPGYLILFLGEIILKLCDIVMATHLGKAGARMESLERCSTLV